MQKHSVKYAFQKWSHLKFDFKAQVSNFSYSNADVLKNKAQIGRAVFSLRLS